MFRVFCVLGVSLVGLSGCASTSFVSTWQEPLDGPIEFQGKRVAAVVLSPDPSTRRAAENALSRELSRRGAQGTPSYTLIQSEEQVKDEGAARRILQEAGIEGAVVMRVTSTDKELNYNQGTAWYGAPYYGSFYGYWGWGWGAVYSPGYLTTDTILYVETLIYSVTDDKLLWAGQSKTTNPSDVDKFIRELSSAAANEMRKAGFIS